MGMEKSLLCNVRHLRAFADSELMCKQVNGEYEVRSLHLIPLHERAKSLARRFQTFQLSHHYRESNSPADALANMGVDAGLNSSVAEAQGFRLEREAPLSDLSHLPPIVSRGSFSSASFAAFSNPFPSSSTAPSLPSSSSSSSLSASTLPSSVSSGPQSSSLLSPAALASLSSIASSPVYPPSPFSPSSNSASFSSLRSHAPSSSSARVPNMAPNGSLYGAPAPNFARYGSASTALPKPHFGSDLEVGYYDEDGDEDDGREGMLTHVSLPFHCITLFSHIGRVLYWK